jgi:putative copper export protein
VDEARSLVLKVLWLAALALVLGSWLQLVLLALRLGGLNELPNLLLDTRTGLLGLIRQTWLLSGLMLALWRLPPTQPGYRPRFWLALIFYHLIVLLLLIGVAIKGDWFAALGAFAVSAMALAPLLQKPAPIEERENQVLTTLLFLAGLVLFSFPLGNHASAAPGWVWAVAADYLHLLAAAAWLGGLALLPLLAWRVWRGGPPLRSDLLWPLVQRFSRLATLAIFVLIVTGLFNSLVQLPSLASLWETTYGRVLLVKLGLTGLVLSLAFLNNRWVSRPHPLQEAGTWLRFQRQVTVEAVFSLGLMLSVAVLVQTSKPTAPIPDVAQPSQPFSYIAQADDLSIHVEILPNQVGQNLFLTHLYHADGSPIGEVQLVRLFFNYQEAQLGQATVDLEDRGGGTYGLEGAYLNGAGQWKLSVYVRRRGLDDALTEVNLGVPAPTAPVTRASPWQNPIAGWPAGLVIAGVVGAIGAGCFLWFQRRPELDHEKETIY